MVIDAAREDALRDLQFAGAQPFAGIAPDKVEQLKSALVDYAGTGAARAFDCLSLHKKIAE